MRVSDGQVSVGSDDVIVVSGLPRSGTSMMMSMLKAGGVPVLSDGRRRPDENNPEGYLEFERVKRLRDGDDGWLGLARGKAVKVVSPLLMHLPNSERYHVLFMTRKLDEVLGSQARMLERESEEGAGEDQDEMAALYREHLTKVKGWLRNKRNFRTLEIAYREVVSDPVSQARRVDEFLGGRLQVRKMAEVVDPDLYRERASEP